jgi:hypothetical protein
MKKYKELKYNKKTITEQYEINKTLLKEGFQWFLDCEVEDVRLEISHNTLIFNAGTFFNGTWKYGVFRDGVWKYGTWENGVWYNGKWFNGIFKSGIIFDGKFFHGTIESGEIKGGEFYNMKIDKNVKKQEEPKKQEPEDNTVPQGEKITIEKMKNIKSFNEFRKINERKTYNTKEEIWDRLIEIDSLLRDMDKDTDEAINLAGEYAELEAQLDALESLEETEPEKGPDISDSDDLNPNQDLLFGEEPEANEPKESTDIEPEEEIGFSTVAKPIERPEPTPQSRREEWDRLSFNTGGPKQRKIFTTFDDYLKHQGEDPTKYKEPEKRNVERSGKIVRRKS